jgi:hypothetical protein
MEGMGEGPLPSILSRMLNWVEVEILMNSAISIESPSFPARFCPVGAMRSAARVRRKGSDLPSSPRRLIKSKARPAAGVIMGGIQLVPRLLAVRAQVKLLKGPMSPIL